MSDEFIALATKEINDEIMQIESILDSCKNDTDVFENSDKFQKHTHKIKGLAPMMGKESLGTLSATLDNIFKKIIDGQEVPEIYPVLLDSISHMKNSMLQNSYDLDNCNNKIKQLVSEF